MQSYKSSKFNFNHKNNLKLPKTKKQAPYKVCSKTCPCGCHWFGEDSDFNEGETCFQCGGMPKPPKQLGVKEWKLFGRDTNPMGPGI